MTETEIDDMKKEVIILRMQNKRLDSDLKKMQDMVKDILIMRVGGENGQADSDEISTRNCT